MVGGASKLTAQFPCSQNYLNTVDYFTYRLTRTDLPSGWLQVLDFSRNPGDPAAASYVAVAELAVTGATCAFDITQADIPGADNDRGMFQLRLVRRRPGLAAPGRRLLTRPRLGAAHVATQLAG